MAQCPFGVVRLTYKWDTSPARIIMTLCSVTTKCATPCSAHNNKVVWVP